MKKPTLILASVAVAGMILSAAAGGGSRTDAPEPSAPVGMGFLISDESRPAGWYSFPLTDASSPEMVAETPMVSAGAMADGVYYAQTYTPGPVPAAWNRFDPATGTMTPLADAGDDTPLYVDMTYDYSEGRLLAISHYGATSTTLQVVDPADGSATVYVDIPGLWLMTLACSYEGDIYSVASDGNLYRFDKPSMAFVTVGKVDSGIEYMQSMEFDHATGGLYWAACTSWGGYLYTIDTLTGRYTYISDLGSDGEMTGLYIPFKLADDAAPAAISGLTISDPSHDGNATLALTLPDRTAAGEPLGGIASVVVEADGEVVATNTGGDMAPGVAVSFEATLPLGFHTFKVYAVNDAGKGVPRSKRCFIGEDVPSHPADVTVVADGLDVTVSWLPVTTGAQGGWIDPSAVVYDVVRTPGDVTVASGTKATTCQDRVDETGVYTYLVTPRTPKGEGAAASSAPTVLGDEVGIPYTCDFEDADQLLMWHMLDINGDGYTWERGNTMDGRRTMLMRGAYGRTVDDLLVTPGLHLEAGKAYKVVYDAGCMNIYYPAHYTLTFGKEPTAEGQSVLLKEFDTDLRFLNKTIVYLPEIEETGTYHIGFRAQWQPGLPTLYVSNVTVEENAASWLTGTVTDGENPVAGATVTFGEGDDTQTAVTADDGSFEFIEIIPGTHPWSVSMFGFEPRSGEYVFSPLEHKQVEIALDRIPVANLSGRVTDMSGRGLENASVSIHGYDVYAAVTDRDGNFSAPGVYRKGGYTIDVHAVNYEAASRTITSVDGDTDLGTFQLEEKLIAPGNVTVEADREASVVTWDAPADTPAEFRYDDGSDNLVFSMEMSSVSEYTAVGVIYDTPAVFTSMSWHVWDTATYAETVDVIVFDLDEDGNPTNRILYEENGLESENYNWHECRFSYPVVAPRGALFTLRGDARLCMDSGGDNPLYPPMYDKMVMAHDYRTEPFTSRYADDGTHIFRGNLLLRAEGMPYGAPRKASAEGSLQTGYDIWRLPEGKEGDTGSWIKLNTSLLTDTRFDDTAWGTAAKGMWRYAVKAVYADGHSSYASFSPAVPRSLTSSVEITLLTNAAGEDASGASVVLAGNDNSYGHTAEADASGKVLFPCVWEGEYTLTCTKKGFETLTEVVEISGEADPSLTYTLKETMKMPFNLKVEETLDPASRLLRWNVVMGLFDDLEGHDDWAINSPGEVGWSYVDGDGAESYFSTNYEYPGQGEPMAFVVMNPSATTPSMLDSNFLDAHSGRKVLLTWATRNGEPNDDYIISPLLEMGDDFVVSFWARCYWWRYEETLRVGYSLEGNSSEDFVWVGEPVTVDYEDWRQTVVNIPGNAKYVAINCISENNFFVALDDIFIGAADKIPGVADAAAPSKVAGQPVAYDIYLDNEKVGSTAETSHLFENLSNGSHTAGVTARYASGETAMATIGFDISQSGLDGEVASSPLFIRAHNGKVVVDGAEVGTDVRVYRPDGTLAASAIAGSERLAIPLQAGVYVVSVSQTVVSLLIR